MSYKLPVVYKGFKSSSFNTTYITVKSTEKHKIDFTTCLYLYGTSIRHKVHKSATFI